MLILTTCVTGPQAMNFELMTAVFLSIFALNACGGGNNQPPTSDTPAQTQTFSYGLDYARLKGSLNIDQPAQIASMNKTDWVKAPQLYWDIVQPSENGAYHSRFVSR